MKKILKKMKDLLKRALEPMRVDRELEKRVEDYNDNLYHFCWEEPYCSSGECIPYYFYWGGYARHAFGIFSTFAVGIICTLICATFHPESSMRGVIALAGLLVAYLIIALLYYIPPSYWSMRKEFKKVRVIRLNTRKAIAQFEYDYARAEALAKPYREQHEKEMAAREAAEEEKRQLEAEAKAQEAEELRNKFRPQYMALLQYVETYYKVSTPDPDIYDGFFTIVLPDTESADENAEISFCYTEKESDVNRLIDWITRVDSVARKRAELRDLINAAVELDHIPSSSTQNMEE